MKILFLLFLFIATTTFAGINIPSLKYYPSKIDRNIGEAQKNKVLIFLSKTCPCTQKNIPYIEELKGQFPDIEFIGIHSTKNSTPEAITEIFNLFHPTFTIGDDKSLAMANTFKANRTPQAIILDENNNILYNGGITERTDPQNAKQFYLKNALTELSHNQPITEKETRSLGCVIVR